MNIGPLKLMQQFWGLKKNFCSVNMLILDKKVFIHQIIPLKSKKIFIQYQAYYSGGSLAKLINFLIFEVYCEKINPHRNR